MKNEIRTVRKEVIDNPAQFLAKNIRALVAGYESRMHGLRTATGIKRARQLSAKKVDDSMRGLYLTSQPMEKLDEKQISELREVLRLSIGDHADKLSEDELNDLGMTLLEATAVALKAKHSWGN